MLKTAISLSGGAFQAIAARRGGRVAAELRGKFGKLLPGAIDDFRSVSKAEGITGPHSMGGVPFVGEHRITAMHKDVGTPVQSRDSVGAITKMHEYHEGVGDRKSRLFTPRDKLQFSGHDRPSVIMQESNMIRRAQDPAAKRMFTQSRNSEGVSGWLSRVNGKSYGNHFSNAEMRNSDRTWGSIRRKAMRLDRVGNDSGVDRLMAYASPVSKSYRVRGLVIMNLGTAGGHEN